MGKIKVKFVFFLLLFGLTFSQTASATIYEPGETLEPDCPPESVDCGVAAFSLNDQIAAVQTLVAGSAGADFSISSAGNVHSFNLPSASAIARGLLTAADWLIFNGKQDALVSGTNIKTVGGVSLLGSGDIAVGGPGTVTDVSVVTANGVSGSFPTSSPTPAITLTLGAITPTTVNGITLSGSSTPTVEFTGASAISGTNTGDQDLSGYLLKTGDTMTGNLDLSNGSDTSLLRIFASDSGSDPVTDGGIVIGDPASGYGIWQGPATLEGITVDANNDFSSFGDLYFNYYSSGIIYANVGGGSFQIGSNQNAVLNPDVIDSDGIPATAYTFGTLNTFLDAGSKIVSFLNGGSEKAYINERGGSFFSGNISALNLSGTNTGDQTTITGNAGTATALVANGTNCSAGLAPLGVDASGVVESCTDFEEDLSNSAGLLAALSDETGTGLAVFSTSPILVTPNLGTPSALVGTNITGTAAGLTAGNVTTNANLTGAITSVGNATSLGSFSSANLSGALTDETGSGLGVFATSPVFTTPNIGSATGSVSGNAGTATALQTARTIGGVSFDGTANITVASATGGFTVSGALAANGGISIAANALTGTTGIIDYTNFDVDASGNTDIGGTITAGSSNTAVTLATGLIDADALTLITAADGGTGTSSGSGLIARSDGIGLLQGCADGQVLKWVESTDSWDCATDATGAGGTPNMNSFTDSTLAASWTDADTNELWDDATRPNITPSSATSEILVMVTVRGATAESGGADQNNPTFRVDRETGVTADCADVNTVGPTVGESVGDQT